jgi:hypothetical protein
MNCRVSRPLQQLPRHLRGATIGYARLPDPAIVGIPLEPTAKRDDRARTDALVGLDETYCAPAKDRPGAGQTDDG